MLKSPLTVKRTLSTGEKVLVGKLAENSQQSFFQFDEAYLDAHSTSLAPFNLKPDTSLQVAPKSPHYGIHGVFADSLPDGWGLYLMDRVFRQNDHHPKEVTALERLAYLGDRGMGALSYEPELDFLDETKESVDIITLGRAAIEEFEGTESALLEHLMKTGGSGGARPKMNVTRLSNGQYSTSDNALGTKLIVKLTSEKFDLKHSESLVEYCYMQMARHVGIAVPDFNLIDAGHGRFWLEQERFDCTKQGGRLHMISACGLLDAPFREPSLDYVDLVKATRIMCSITESQKLIKRGLFNYLTINQDDHSKNFSFLASDADNWTLSPFYDIVYSPSPYKEHMTAFGGNGRTPKHVLDQLAAQSGLSSKKAIMVMAEEIFDATRSFSHEAKHLGLSPNLIKEINKGMVENYKTL
ncbi:type II toxin-antitoxin system HipA family toxin [Vibrio coralliilyticus]|uniref:type II toxin-antitoxin system HipA family toxin n=1 Tax=Vibrio coralliilyticus TaxID=190893 RepID=UPI0006CD5E06|nr:type II toxin-antitoxin system HipA family toxin [Vibrio coralliilyticus]AXN34730.1 type II toxin-antitoxin system HipA family toxin [Vibrio coralliilyticus]KPH25081.1 phosphatidylinositol kinase [Vibrio coralliilyticus]MCC2524354.1 type II toxin-antitoxin system HipA family toxin [Vibrio coralliilyticus]PAU35993.1 type II toxin-antitoxin system HipA family toxin [Vibrio coralliilyticus]